MSAITNKEAELARLSDFFSRLASGDHRSLSKELNMKPYRTNRTDAPIEASPKKPQAPSRASQASPQFSAASRHGANIVDRDEAEAAFPLEHHRDFTFKLMIHSLYNLADFAKMVAEVLSESQAKFQPLPEVLKRRKLSETMSDMLNGDNTWRTLKKRRMETTKRGGLASNAQDDPVAFDKRPASQATISNNGAKKSGHSPSSSLSSCLSMTFSGETTESELESEPSTRASGSYDEEAVLHFVRDLCEEQVATSKQNDNYGEADLSPPQSASSTESSFVFNESLQPSTCPRARMKRRLSN